MRFDMTKHWDFRKFIGLEVRIKFKDGTWCEGFIGQRYNNHTRKFMSKRRITMRKGLLIFREREEQIYISGDDISYISLA